MNRRASVLLTLTLALAAGAIGLAGSPAQAAQVGDGDTVQVCPSESYSLIDSAGQPISQEDRAFLEYILQWKCVNPDAGPTGVINQDGTSHAIQGHSIPGVGYLAANLIITPGQMTWSASASSMPYGTKRTLTCMARTNYKAWVQCGKDQGNGTSLQTQTNYICPPKGQHFEVEAILGVGGADFFDTAEGTTK